MTTKTRALRTVGAAALSTVVVGLATSMAIIPAVAQPPLSQPLTVPADASPAAPTAYSAGTKLVGETTNTWGWFDTTRPITAWTEVNVNGTWSRSQTTTTDSSGYFVIPLTYGSTTPGTYTYRVVGQYPDGSTGTSNEFTLTRLSRPTAHSAGRKQVAEVTNTWGRFHENQAIPAWTEVNINGTWSRSQQVTTDNTGYFVIPLTYGSTTPGAYTYRVRGQHPDGTIATTNEFTLTRMVGTKNDWLRESGIPQADWQYVDYIVTRESNWNPRAVNPYSGACGLAQALPCYKVGAEWYDPVVSLRWQHRYVTQRYGGYAGAYSFWLRNNWY